MTQKEIYKKIAKKYDLSLTQVEELVDLYSGFIAEKIVEAGKNRDENNCFIIKDFPNFKLPYLGTLRPYKKCIVLVNKAITRKQQKLENELRE